MTAPAPDLSAVRLELERVLASAGFARNARMSAFLRFLVDGHVEGRDVELKESLIGIEVFGRRPDYDPKTDSIVRTEAARLRARLAEYYAGEGQAASIVIEIPKGGYVPALRVGTGRQPALDQEPVPPLRRSMWPWAAAALALAVAAAVGIWWMVRPGRSPITIAVLPLVNLGQEASRDYVVDGLTDEIIGSLSLIDGLAVRSRTSSFMFKGQSPDVHDVGRRLGVDYVVEGAALLVGNQLRVNIKLVRVRDDSALWSEQFDRTLTDIFAVQDEISVNVVNSLRLHLGSGRRRYETSVAAHDAYLSALAMSFQPNAGGDFGAIDAYARAVALDKSYAPAYAGLGAGYAIRSVQYPLRHSGDELDKMRRAARRAVELDPFLAEAHDALGLAQARDGRWEEADHSFQRAIALDPNRSLTRTHYTMWLLLVLGRTDDALREMRKAELSDPLSSEVQLALAWTLMAAGHFDQAEQHCAQMSDEHSLARQCLGRSRFGAGKTNEAIQTLSGDTRFNPQTSGYLGYALARSGRSDDAERMAAGSLFPNEQTLIFSGLGDLGRTLDALDQMSLVGPQRVGQYLYTPELAWVRADPRSSALRQRVGLPN